MSAEGIGRLLAAAGTLSDTELAVALQGLLVRRPAAREVLLNVWRAEEALASPFPPRAAAGGTLPKATAGAVAATAAAAAPAPKAQPKFVPVQSSSARFVVEACGYAARAGARKLSSEHVLAAAVFLMPEEATHALGGPLLLQLSDLLKKSNLEPLAPGSTPNGGENLPRLAEVEQLFSVLDAAGPAALFAALQKLPDQAAATQLLEMARIFMARSTPQPPQPQEPPQPGGGDEEPPEKVDRAEQKDGASTDGIAARILARARCFAAFNGGNSVGSEHFLACAVDLFPEAARDALTEPVYTQMVELLGKSQLEPPPADGPTGEGLAVESGSQELLELLPGLEAEDGPKKLFEALQELPDNAAAIQLLEMAKIFADRSS